MKPGPIIQCKLSSTSNWQEICIFGWPSFATNDTFTV